MSAVGPKRTRRSASVVAAFGGKAAAPLATSRGSFWSSRGHWPAWGRITGIFHEHEFEGPSNMELSSILVSELASLGCGKNAEFPALFVV